MSDYVTKDYSYQTFSFDGLTTLDGIIDRLEEFVAIFNEFKEDGWELETEVEDDHVIITKKAS